MKIKTCLILLVLTVNLYANKIVIVEGTITNPNNKIVRIEYNHTLLDKKKIYYDKIDDNGNFRIEFNMDYPQDVELKYGKDYLTLYLHPGDSTFLSFKTNDIKNSIIIHGDNAQMNIQLQNLINGYRKLLISQKFDEKDNKLDPAEYKLFIKQFLSQTDSLVQSLNTGEEISEWMKNYALYDCLEELFDNGRDNKIPYSDSYFNFIEQYETNTSSGLNCTKYSDFINVYFYYQCFKINLFEDLKQYYIDKDYYAILKAFFDNFQENTNFTTKCVLTRQLYYYIGKSVNSVDSISKDYFSVLGNEMMCEIIIREIENYKTQKKKLFTLEELSNHEFIGTIFSDIRKKHLGKTIYIDGWQSCPYNYKRFPYAEKLRSELKNKEIAFVYICTPDNDDLWQENIMKYKIDGDNYKLSDDQKIVLYSLFNYEHGTYNMIINKNGVIIDPDADDPNSETIKQQLLTIIEQ